MDALRWKLLRHLFETAMDLSPDACESYLAAATSDVELRNEVRTLLAADRRNRGMQKPRAGHGGCTATLRRLAAAYVLPG